MVLLRRNRFWLALVVALTMVFTIGGTSAYAMANAMTCAEMASSLPASGSSTAAHLEQTENCREGTVNGHCCCRLQARAALLLAPAGRPEAAATESHPGCGCAIQAPLSQSVPSLKAATQVLSENLAVLTHAPILFHLAAPTFTYYAVSTTGSPRSPACASGPSRAPPAC